VTLLLELEQTLALLRWIRRSNICRCLSVASIEISTSSSLCKIYLLRER